MKPPSFEPFYFVSCQGPLPTWKCTLRGAALVVCDALVGSLVFSSQCSFGDSDFVTTGTRH